MTTARSQLICPEITPYYHCVSRCVRRSFLCGKDELTGRNYEHRRAWVENRILTLASIYCIQICAYAVMSNHYHLVAYIDNKSAQNLSDHQVIERWCTEHKMHPLIQSFISGEHISKSELKACKKLIQIWRERLSSLSWFMKELNYAIAVQANQEDDCTGRFWEGRFKSQALLDEKALMAAMTYVDLNPVRAKLATTPEQSDFTSIKRRLNHLKQGKMSTPPLADFVGEEPHKPCGIPFHLMDYLEMLDWVGRQVRNNKLGYINDNYPEIFDRLKLSHQEYFSLCTNLEKKSYLWVGSSYQLNQAKTKLKRKRMVGIHIS